ncbi:hypothetical protein G7054_g929 [Neopestalotiopsis clavispora]|nr:hypothetical protein G7054_g929 [Neopestalotiopsis clavispora]
MVYAKYTQSLAASILTKMSSKYACLPFSAFKIDEDSIVAIHGLDTQSPRQWEAWKTDGDQTSERVHWLKDVHMLPSKITNARIYTYDWNANLDKGAGADSLFGFAESFLEALLIHSEDHNDRPLVFIASCFGGLLLIRALSRAAEYQSEYQRIIRLTAGAIFLGTPFQACHSTFSTAAQVRALVAANAGGQSAEELASYLNQDYKLDEVVQRFREVVKIKEFTFPITCYYETLASDFRSLHKYLTSGLFEEVRLEDSGITIRNARCRETYDWLFNTDELSWWIQDDGARVLWLNGDAGIGKSTMTAYLINQFQSTLLTRAFQKLGIHDAPVVLHAFCHYQNNRSASMVICVLIHQLLRLFPRLVPTAFEGDIRFYLLQTQNHATTPGESRLAHNLWSLFTDIVQATHLPQLFIFVDSFDTLGETSRQELFKEMSSNLESSSERTVIKIFVTSRPGHDIKEWHSRWTVQRPKNFRDVDMAKWNDRLQADVDHFIDLEFLRLRRLDRHLPRELDRIKEQLREDQFRNFLIATLCCKQLENTDSLDSRDVFKQVSEDLEGFYRELLSQVPLNNLQRSSSFVMASVAYSFRSLTTPDLALISYYEINHGSTRLAPRWPFDANEEDLMLARIAAKRYEPVLKLSESGGVSFSHDYLRDYCIRHFTNVAPLFVPNHRGGHRRMAIICIVCIVSNSKMELPATYASMSSTRKELSKRVFLKYACQYWHKHLMEAVPSNADINDVDPELECAVKAILYLWREPEAYRFREVLLIMTGYQSLSGTSTAIELLSGLGLATFLRIYLNKQNQNFLRTNMYAKAQNAVLLAAKGGHEACFEIILDKFEITSLEGAKFRTIKADAASANHPRILERITKMRPSSDILELVEALVAAFTSGDKASAAQIVKGSDIRGLNHFGMNALHLLFVSQNRVGGSLGSPAVAGNSPGGLRGSGLCVIIDVVKFLIVEGRISVLDIDNFGFTALHWMCYYTKFCHRSLIELLIDHGAEPRCSSHTGLTPLHLAVYNTDNGDAIQCLLHHGSPNLVGMVSNGYMTPLHWAVLNRPRRDYGPCDKGPSAVEVLLRHGADWHARNARGLTPMQWAGNHVEDLQWIYAQYDGIHVIPIAYPAEQLLLEWERRGSYSMFGGRKLSVTILQVALQRRAGNVQQVEASRNDTTSAVESLPAAMSSAGDVLKIEASSDDPPSAVESLPTAIPWAGVEPSKTANALLEPRIQDDMRLEEDPRQAASKMQLLLRRISKWVKKKDEEFQTTRSLIQLLTCG